MNERQLKQFLIENGQCSENTLHQYIIPHSVPVFWFGNRLAQVATVGINCGPEEFNPSNTIKQHWGKKHQIGMNSFSDNVDEIILHFDQYFTYTNSCKKVFWSKWESLLNLADVSYHRSDMNEAFHFDLVPWATEPVWGSLSTQTQSKFLEASKVGRDTFFQQTSANVFLCQGKTVTELTGSTLGFWQTIPPWKETGESKFIIEKHPKLDKWIIGWNRWYYSNADKSYAATVLSHILNHQSKPLPEMLISTNTSTILKQNQNTGQIAMDSSIDSFSSDSQVTQYLIDLMIDVGRKHWPTIDFNIKDATDWWGIFTNTHQKRKLLTIHKNEPDIEFSRACITQTDRDLLEPHLTQIRNTWNTVSVTQVRLNGLSIHTLERFDPTFRRIFQSILEEHPHFGKK